MVKIIFFICLIVANLSFAEKSPNPAPGPREESQPVQNASPKENQKTDRPYTTSETVPPTNSQPSAPAGNQDVHNPSSQPGQPPSDNRIVLLTLGLLIVGGIQAFIYCRQASYMRQGLDLAKQSAQAAQDSADAAKRSAEVAEIALKLTERAYITIGHWGWVDPIGASPGTISYTLINTGRTPARLIGYFEDRIVDGRPIDIGLDYREHLLTGGQEVMISAQGEHRMFIKPNDHLLPEQWRQIEGGAMPLYAFAHVEYADVFGEQYEMGCLVAYDHRMRRFRVHENHAYNYNRKKGH